MRYAGDQFLQTVIRERDYQLEVIIPDLEQKNDELKAEVERLTKEFIRVAGYPPPERPITPPMNWTPCIGEGCGCGRYPKKTQKVKQAEEWANTFYAINKRKPTYEEAMKGLDLKSRGAAHHRLKNWKPTQQ